MRKFDDRVWFQLFKCPLCGYKTNVTNVCRQCPKAPISEHATSRVYCNFHKTFHTGKNGEPMMHKSVRMVPTEWAVRYNPNLQREERRKIKNLPKDAMVK